MKVHPLQLNQRQCVVSAVAIVAVPLAHSTNSSSWCKAAMEAFLSAWAGVDRKGVETAQSWTARHICLPTSQGPPGDSSAPLETPFPLHSGPTSHQEEARRVQLPVAPFLSWTLGSKGEQSRFTINMDPLKHFMVIFMSCRVSISYSWWIHTYRYSYMSVRFRGADKAGAPSPRWMLTPAGCKDTSYDPVAICNRFSPPQKHRPFGCRISEIPSHNELVTLPYLSLSLSASPQWLIIWNSAGNGVFIFRAEQNVSRWQPRLAVANRDLVVLNMVSSLALWPFLERALLLWYRFLLSHCTGENRGQW